MSDNIRNKTITTETGKDVKSTQQLSGSAKETKAWNSKNETTQHLTGAQNLGGGGKGGRNTNS
jgi:hypothetical protein